MTDKPEDDGQGVSALRGNGYDPAILEKFVERVEWLIGDIGRERSESMLRCKAIRSDIKEVYKEARGAGIPKKALAQIIETRDLKRKLDEAQNALEGEDQESYEQMLSALGMLADTPLGTAAIAGKHPDAPVADGPAVPAAPEV